MSRWKTCIRPINNGHKMCKISYLEPQEQERRERVTCCRGLKHIMSRTGEKELKLVTLPEQQKSNFNIADLRPKALQKWLQQSNILHLILLHVPFFLPFLLSKCLNLWIKNGALNPLRPPSLSQPHCLWRSQRAFSLRQIRGRRGEWKEEKGKLGGGQGGRRKERVCVN